MRGGSPVSRDAPSRALGRRNGPRLWTAWITRTFGIPAGQELRTASRCSRVLSIQIAEQHE